MRNTVRRRLAALEDGGAGPCSLCGLDPTLPPRYVLGGDLVDDPAPDEPMESTPPCPRCGNRAIVVVDLVDAFGVTEGGGADG